VMAATVARVGRPGRYAVMLSDLLALLAEGAVGIKTILQPFQARCIVGKVTAKLGAIVGTLAARGTLEAVSVSWGHTPIVGTYIPTVKG